MTLIAGIDIGGTQTRCAIAEKNRPQEISFRTSFPTPQQGPDSVLDIAVDLILSELENKDTLCAVGCVAPGMVNTQNGVVLRAANLKGWIDTPLQYMLETKTGTPTAIENDVNAAVIAEGAQSNAPYQAPIVYLTISTGIAAGILINGEVLRGENFSAGEIGGMIPSPKFLGQQWQPGGCTELHASGVGIATQWARMEGGPHNSVHTAEVFEAADKGNAKAKELIHDAMDYIAQAAVGLTCVLDPAVIIIGGSIGLARPEILRHICQELRNCVPAVPEVKISQLGDDAPLLGSLILADSISSGNARESW